MDAMKKMKKPAGRKKIEMKEIDKHSNKQVTFSKRRAGLFKKASELCVLCDAQVAIIVFSPADKAFCFGQPNIEAVLRRYLKHEDRRDEPVRTAPQAASEIDSLVSFEELNRQHEEAVRTLETEKQQLEEVKNMTGVWDGGNWWDEPIDEMDLDRLHQYVLALQELQRNVAVKADQLSVAPPQSSATSFHGESSFGGLPHGSGNAGGGYASYANRFGGGGGLVAYHDKF